ncbi:MAG: hypothetical protein OEZ16_05540 [Chromatiales bacterium]|nr:hypothetical protein [Chromatiales bacterium]
MGTLTVIVNGEAAYEYDKGIELEPAQLEFLDRMDQDMSRGLKIHGKLINNPDTQQRATFVALNLIKALMQRDEARIRLSCGYLVSRQPELYEVEARDGEGVVNITLS